jgi:hypothetical protein
MDHYPVTNSGFKFVSITSIERFVKHVCYSSSSHSSSSSLCHIDFTASATLCGIRLCRAGLYFARNLARDWGNNVINIHTPLRPTARAMLLLKFAKPL